MSTNLLRSSYVNMPQVKSLNASPAVLFKDAETMPGQVNHALGVTRRHSSHFNTFCFAFLNVFNNLQLFDVCQIVWVMVKGGSWITG